MWGEIDGDEQFDLKTVAVVVVAGPEGGGRDERIDGGIWGCDKNKKKPGRYCGLRIRATNDHVLSIYVWC